VLPEQNWKHCGNLGVTRNQSCSSEKKPLGRHAERSEESLLRASIEEEERFLVASVVGMTGGGHIDDGACLTKAEKVHDSASPEAEVLPVFFVRYIV